MVTLLEQARGAAYNTVVADGKPHKHVEIDLVAQADITPMKCVRPAAGAVTFDYAIPSSAITVFGDLWITEIPMDYSFNGTDRKQMDKATAFAASSTKVPAVKCEVGREYYLTTAVDLTGTDEGSILVLGTDDVALCDQSPDALTTTANAFALVYAVSTTEIIVRYLGLVTVDLAP